MNTIERHQRNLKIMSMYLGEDQPTGAEVAKAFGVSDATVSKVVNEYVMESHRRPRGPRKLKAGEGWNAERDAKIAELYRTTTMTLAEIGEQFGITRERARQIAKREVDRSGLEHRRPKRDRQAEYAAITPEQKLEIENRHWCMSNICLEVFGDSKQVHKLRADGWAPRAERPKRIAPFDIPGVDYQPNRPAGNLNLVLGKMAVNYEAFLATDPPNRSLESFGLWCNETGRETVTPQALRVRLERYGISPHQFIVSQGGYIGLDEGDKAPALDHKRSDWISDDRISAAIDEFVEHCMEVNRRPSVAYADEWFGQQDHLPSCATIRKRGGRTWVDIIKRSVERINNSKGEQQ